jgi:TATA-binding protein-associated factor Taf7
MKDHQRKEFEQLIADEISKLEKTIADYKLMVESNVATRSLLID